MRKVFCVIIILLNLSKGISQFNLIAEKTNGLCYLGMDNPLYLCSSSTDLSNIELKTDNGKIDKNDGSLFYFRPAFIGRAKIRVFKKGKEVADFNFIVQKLLPNIILENYKGDSIPINSIPFLIGLRAEFTNLIICGIQMDIKSFKTLIFRGDTLLYNIRNEGRFFSKETKQMFQNLKADDTITFVKILCKLPYGLVELDDKHYYIK
jgi:hypothetical protein